MIVLRKFVTRPYWSVSRPSSNTPMSVSNTSGRGLLDLVEQQHA